MTKKKKINQSTMNYKVYTFLFRQSGQDVPDITVLENTLGGNPVWERVEAGNYTATLLNGFIGNTIAVGFGTRDENSVFIPLSYNTKGFYCILAGDHDSIITVNSMDETLALKEFSEIGGEIWGEIRVYP